jgi:hypothetical protein
MTPGSLVPITDVRPGATLAEALCDAGGALLRPAGYVLAEADLENLQRRGIQALVIVTPRDPAEDMRLREAARARVLHIFRHSADAPEAQALLHAVLAFRQEYF